MSLIQTQGAGIAPVEQRESYDPTTLGAMSLWLDFDDASTIWQDTAGTVPAAAIGDPIKRIDDKSGNGFNFTNSSSTTRPTLGLFEGTKKCGDWGTSGNTFLEASAASVLSFMYKGSPFTAIFNFKKTSSSQYDVLWDTAAFSSAVNGMTIFSFIQSTIQFTLPYYQSYNSNTHTSGSGKSLTTIQDPEYMAVAGNYTDRGNADAVLMVGNDVTTGYVQTNNNVLVSTAALGSPASVDGVIKATLGGISSITGYSLKGYIRRVWIWPTLLSSNDRATAITKIQL